jgi:hypothetical protein
MSTPRCSRKRSQERLRFDRHQRAHTAENNVYLDIGTPLAVKSNIESAFIAPPAAPE